MGLIKSNLAPSSLTHFSMRDIKDEAEAILLHARKQAEALLHQAQIECIDLKKSAIAQGLSEGRATGLTRGGEEGKKNGYEKALAENRTLFADTIKTFAQTLKELEKKRVELESHAMRDVVELSIAIARRVTKRQGAFDPEVLAANISAAMKLVVHASDVRIAVNPKQKRTLEDILPRLQLDWPNLEHVELIEDAQLGPGGCRIFTTQGHIDADLEGQLDRIVADLLPANAETPA